MTTDPHDEHGEILRRALHAEAESVIPAGDGLDRIRARIAEEPRRGPFGRFSDRLGLSGLAVGWARPVLAVAAAVAIAGFGVTAGPQTIDLIQHTVTGEGPSDPGAGDTEGDRTGAQPPPGVVPGDPSSPAPTPSATPSTSQEAGTPPASPGLSSCVIPRGGASAAATASPTPTSTGTPAPGGQPCPSRTPSATPTKTPTKSPTPPDDTSPDPSKEPTPTSSGTPSTTSEQNAPAGP